MVKSIAQMESKHTTVEFYDALRNTKGFFF